jgi:hypothetical protein
MLPACKKKGDDNGDDSATTEQQTNRGIQSLAERAPGDLTNAMLIRDLTKSVEGLGPMIDRVQAYVGDLSPFEADLRNTLGVDIRHPERLSEIGVKPSGQALFYQNDDARVMMVSLSDREKFAAHVKEVLQGAPFSLRAPVEEQEQAGQKIYQFKRSESAPVKVSVITDEALAIVLYSMTSEAPTVEDYLTSPEENLGDNESFQATAERLSDYPIVFWGQPETLYAQRPADLKFEPLKSQLETLVDAAHSAGMGLQFRGDRLRGEYALAFDESDEITELKELYMRGEEAPSFAEVATGDAYAIFRLVVEPDMAVENLFERLAGIDTSVPESEQQTALNEIIERDFQETVLPAFGTHIFVAATRARLITLSSMMDSGGPDSLGELADSFGLIMSMELRERPPVQFVIDKLIEKEIIAAEKREEEGAIIYALKEGDDDAGTLVLENKRMTFLPRKQARELTIRLVSGETKEMDQFHTDEARSLAGRTDAAGVALDVDEILNGPLGNLLGNAAPDQIESSFNLVDEAWLRWSFQQNTLRAPYEFVLNERPE